MSYVKGESRQQINLMPEVIDDYIMEENQVRFIDAFVEKSWSPEIELITPKLSLRGLNDNLRARGNLWNSVSKLKIYSLMRRCSDSHVGRITITCLHSRFFARAARNDISGAVNMVPGDKEKN